jgi:hypothetical protein
MCCLFLSDVKFLFVDGSWCCLSVLIVINAGGLSVFLPLFLHIETLSHRSDTLATPMSILPLLLDTWGDVLADSQRHQAHSLISHSAMVLGLLLRSTNGTPSTD